MSSELPNQPGESADQPPDSESAPPPLSGQAEAADWTPQDWRPPPAAKTPTEVAAGTDPEQIPSHGSAPQAKPPLDTVSLIDQWTPPYGDVPPAQSQPARWPSYPATQNQPPQWSSYPPRPPTWDKSQNRSWNGLAIASFVLGILPGSLIAVGLGIGALVQIGRGGGKGGWMAIVGIVLGALWTVFLPFGIVGILAAAQDDEPTPPGSASRDVSTLKAGDCTPLIPDGRVGDVPVIDCAKPHRDEVYAVLSLSGSKYPGDTEVENQTNERCSDKLDSILTDNAKLPAGTDTYYVFPDRFLWATGERSVTCLIELPKDYSGRQLPV